MDFIIDFYKSLDILNLIIFWGIIIVIILLLIFSLILINKNKKLKSIVEKNNKQEDLPIKKEEESKGKEENFSLIMDENSLENKMQASEIKEPQVETIIKPIETENKFVAEEHVMEYNNHQEVSTKNEEVKTEHITNTKEPLELPKKPYERNVLREMSLSQTSPIGINRHIQKEDKKIEIAKDLEKSLNLEVNKEEKIIKKETSDYHQEKQLKENNYLKSELTAIDKENQSQRKTEVNNLSFKKEENIETEKNYSNKTTKNNSNINNQTTEAQILLKEQPTIVKENNIKSSSEKYLEEVSKKLAEAEIPDEIERTDYELEQEENAIISYKELMEKKDSIQTIDEEEAVISIEELMKRNNPKEEVKEKLEATEKSKLYKLGEEEENDSFIKELKQFRNDL